MYSLLAILKGHSLFNLFKKFGVSLPVAADTDP